MNGNINNYIMEEKTDNSRCVVYEHRDNGTRFMTAYTKGRDYEDDEHLIIIEKDVSEETAKLLCKQTETKNISSFLDNLPSELRSPRMDGYIAGLIKNGD